MKKAVLLTFIFISGCASIVSEHNYAVNVTSSEPDVSFYVKNKSGKTIAKGTTPTVINLESSDGYLSGESYTFNSMKQGYENGFATLDSYVSKWYIGGNLLFGGLIGWLIVDPLTGSMFNLPENINLTLGEKLKTEETADTKIIEVD